jgi:Domain of unknown function (DUF4288)
MPVYTACQVFEVTNHHQPLCSFFEETWVMVTADHEKGAQKKMLADGIVKEESFLNINNELIYWQFKGIRQLKKLETGSDVEEIVSLSKKREGFVDLKPTEITIPELNN